MSGFWTALACVAVVTAANLSAVPSAAAEQATAIDILLEPDAVMEGHAEAANAELLKDYPKGFALDAAHRPHVTLLQRYVRTADLDKVYAAAGKALASEPYAGWKLTAVKYYYAPVGPVGVAGIVVETTPDLLRLQQALIDAVAPYTVGTATAAAFVTTPADPEINQPTLDYVAGFVPKASGANYNPHVTTGVGTKAYLDALLAKPFTAFTFSPTAAAVYQLGNFGAASKLLMTFPSKP